MASYLLLQREDLYKKVGWFTTNPRHFRIAREVLDRVSDQLGGWVRGEIVLMTTIGVMTYLGLLLFDLPYVLPLAFLAGFLEILPNLGPTIAAVPAVIIAFVTHGPVVAAFVLLLYVIVQQLENNFIVPKIMKDNVDVSPLMTIVVILSGFKLGSIMGALLAVPIYVTARTLYSVWLRETRREHTKGEPTSRK
jgi:predicted PurR-regulated permease PerM